MFHQSNKKQRKMVYFLEKKFPFSFFDIFPASSTEQRAEKKTLKQAIDHTERAEENWRKKDELKNRQEKIYV